MTIYEVNKLLSSENKSKLISHFWNCKCGQHDVSDMVNKLGIAQSNLSKHIGVLLKMHVLKARQEGKERFYSIDEDFKKEWFDVVDPQIQVQTNRCFECNCNRR